MMLSYYAFKIPFTSPFRISNQTLNTRNGIYLVFDTGDFRAYGEIAPLPGFSKETIHQVVAVLLENQRNLEQAILKNEVEQFISILDSIHNFPSLSFGLDLLMLDLKSKERSKSLFSMFTDKDPKKPNVNGAIGVLDVESSVAKAQSIIQEGINTLKIKVGVDQTKEMEVIGAIRKRFPKATIRIDANQAWTPKNALRNLELFEAYDIEYCEQPVSKYDIKGLKKVKNETSIPIAADESALGFNEAKLLIEEHACDVIILKPSLFGRIKNCLLIKELCISNGIELVITTAFDTIIGRTITAVLAAHLGSDKYAHGLATGRYLQETIFLPQEIHQGKYVLPSSAGISLNLDVSNFKKLS